MIDEREIWTAASMVLDQHGDDAPRFIAERIGSLALEGDEVGISVWKLIAHRLDELRSLHSRIQ